MSRCSDGGTVPTARPSCRLRLLQHRDRKGCEPGRERQDAAPLELATSLPEVSTTVDALRLGAYSMAMANLLGTNALEVARILVILYFVS